MPIIITNPSGGGATPPFVLGAATGGEALAAGSTSSSPITFNAPTGGSGSYTYSVAVTHIEGSGATVSPGGDSLGPHTVNNLDDGDVVVVINTITDDTTGQEIRDITSVTVAEAGVSFTTYATYTAMLAASASDGDYGLVQEGESAGVYKYLGTVDSVVFNGWLPSGFAERVTGLCTDASANKCYIDVPAGDNVAALTARGWTDSGHATDVTGYLQLDSSGSVASFTFTHNNNGKEILVYAEVTPVSAAGGSGNAGCQIYARDGARDVRGGFSIGANVGDYRLITSGGGLRGDGESTVADDTPTFLWHQPGVLARMIPLGVSSQEYMSGEEPTGFSSSSSTLIGPALTTGAGTTFKIARLFAFYVN